MPIPLAEQQVLANISKAFHDEFRQLQNTRFQPSEKIFVAANCSQANFRFAKKSFGFFIVTSYRVILVLFDTTGRQRVPYYKPEHGITDFIFGSADSERFWISPNPALSPTELRTRKINEMLLSSIKTCQRKDYPATRDGLQIIELAFQGTGLRETLGSIALNLDEGQAIYNLIQTTIQNGGKIPSENALADSQAEILNLIEQLGKLHAAKVLTDEEFEQKKKDLLSRL